VVNGRKGRRVIVVLGSDRKHYRVLDMDFKKKSTGKSGKGMGEEGNESDGESDRDEEGEEDVDVEMGGG
jgi:anaphase-promoting complex subunit 4